MKNLEYMKLLKLMKQYYKRDQLFGEEFVYESIQIIEKSRKLDGLIKSIEILDKSKIQEGITGSYSPNLKNIQITVPNNKENSFAYNSTLLHLVLHEIEHVCQHKICNDANDNSFDKGLFNTCFASNNFLEKLEGKIKKGNFSMEEMQNLMTQMEFYTKYSDVVQSCYGYLPSERQAEITSLKELCNLFKNIKMQNYQDNMLSIQNGYILRTIMGYRNEQNEFVYPTYELYKNILALYGDNLEKKYFDKFDELSKSMSLEDRLFYGFKISEEEYNGELKKLVL